MTVNPTSREPRPLTHFADQRTIRKSKLVGWSSPVLWMVMLPAFWFGIQPAAEPSSSSPPTSKPNALVSDALVSPVSGVHGGQLVVALRAEPTTFNPATALDNPSLTILRRTTADLVHVDRSTQRPVAALAKSWQQSEDGLEYVLDLRKGIQFSDGEPFDADDVLFTLEVLLDPKVGSPHRDFLMPGGQAITTEKLDSHRLKLKLHRPNAAGLRLFDNLPILPEHLLATPYREGRFSKVWGIDSDPRLFAGLGPFRIESYAPGERLVLSRNPHYWKVDAQGRPLPFLDRLVFVFVADQTAQALRFQAGEVHVVDRLTTEAFAYLQDRPGKSMKDLGPGLEYSFLFFNLNHLGDGTAEDGTAEDGTMEDGTAGGSAAAGGASLRYKQKWFRDLRFRRAVSTAIDRAGIAGLIYADRAKPLATHVTPGIQQWVRKDLEPKPQSLDRARKALEEAGFQTRGNKLYDAEGLPVELTIISTSSNQARMGMATIVQEDLRQLGIGAAVVGLEFRALLDRIFNSFDYEAVVLSMTSGDTDPNALVPVLTSGGGNHLWQLKAGAHLPSWQREIDDLMARQAITLDFPERKRIYGRVQELMAEHLPMIPLVSPHVLTGGAAGLSNFRPTVLGHSTLWNVDELYWKAPVGH